jgi:predicted dehydrogenase
MAESLRLGVIGLGRRWRRRYRPVLRALRRKWQVRAVCDEVAARADREAFLLGGDAVSGPAALVARDDLDAVLLADPQWFGLWPLTLAAGAGKPVYCGVPLSLDDAHADGLCRRVREAGLPVLAEQRFRFSAALAAVPELIRTELGPLRFLSGEITVAVAPDSRSGVPARPRVPASLFGSSGLALLDACAGLFGAAPESVVATGGEGTAFASACWQFPGNRYFHLMFRPAHRVRPTVQLHLLAERGSAAVAFPKRLTWTGADGEHSRRLTPARSASRTLLERFHEAVCEGGVLEPSLDRAYRVLGWLRAARQSQAEDRRVTLSA